MKDLIGEAWEDIRPHVVEDIEQGAFEMRYGVYGLDELDDRHDHLCRCSGCDYDGPEPIDISDEDVAQVWGDTQVVFPVLMEDELRHTFENPFCDDPGCPCHTDEALFQEYIEQPVASGALKIWDAQALLWPER